MTAAMRSIIEWMASDGRDDIMVMPTTSFSTTKVVLRDGQHRDLFFSNYLPTILEGDLGFCLGGPETGHGEQLVRLMGH
jgi:hypothetical protein